MTVPLPDNRSGHLTDLLNHRRSTRQFTSAGVTLDDLAALLWSGYGCRDDGGGVVPSAHALRPLSLITVAGEVTGLPAGTYRYRPDRHDLCLLAAEDHREALASATLVDADWLPHAAALIVITGDIETARTHFADQPPPRPANAAPDTCGSKPATSAKTCTWPPPTEASAWS